ncbi:MAG: hypothetical protein ACOYMA_02530 [Bacteroidia bacterium]
MKYLAFLVFSLLLLFESCCGEGDSGGGYYNRTTYARKIKLTDTTDRILKISYKNSAKIFYPNDTIADLIISENSENTLYIETKNAKDTVVLRVAVNYNYRNETCSSNELTKDINYTPKIVSHTFQNALFYFQQKYDPNNYYNYTYDYYILSITP